MDYADLLLMISIDLPKGLWSFVGETRLAAALRWGLEYFF